MRPILVVGLLAMLTTAALSGCITGVGGTFSDADARIGGKVNGVHDDRLCIPEPREKGDDVTLKLFVDLDGSGEITMTGHDGPPKVVEIDGKTRMQEAPWYRGWNTGEICIDVAVDANGAYALGAYLE